MYKISEEHKESLLAYLLTRPMQEIEAGVYILRELEKIKEDKKITK